MKINYYFGKILYRFIGSKLPCTYSKLFGKISNYIRCHSAKQFIAYLGNNVNIEPHAYFTDELSIDDYSGIGAGSNLIGKVTIGKYVMMGPDCNIYTRNHKFDDLSRPMCFQGFQDTKDVIINDDVWIGSNVTILPGVTIGKGTVIGANAVVTKDLPPFSIAVGNPAQVKKFRNK